MRYQLYYWPSIQGRGEFVRLALEDAALPYRDVARESGPEAGIPAMLELLKARASATPPFAPPFLRAGRLLIAQTANILLFLGAHHGLAPRDERGRLYAHQLQLTVADLVAEVHDTHHPISVELYFKQQRREARRRTRAFLEHRMPKYLGYFEHLPALAAGSRYVLGRRASYVDLSLFQIMEGLRYAFPKTLRQERRRYPRLTALAARVAERPRIAEYLNSPRRIPFNEEGIFRHYPELEA